MLSTTEATLLDKLFGDANFAIFRTAASFLPTDKVTSLGTYLRDLVAKPRQVQVGSAVASASSVTPTAAVNHVTGTTAIDTITVPAGTSTGLVWTVIPDAIFTWTTSSNIALAGTAVVGKALQFVYDPVTGKHYPSYTA